MSGRLDRFYCFATCENRFSKVEHSTNDPLRFSVCSKICLKDTRAFLHDAIDWPVIIAFVDLTHFFVSFERFLLNAFF